MCPSPPPFGIGLGPTNPWMIIIATETLFFRRTGISPVLRLLVPTFSLRHAPPWLTPLASTQRRTLSYQTECTNTNWVLKFGNTFSPDYLRRGFSRSVSCYAIFKGWLLLSQPPDCRWNSTSLSALNVYLGTLFWDLGCFPFDQRSFAPVV